MQPAAFVFARSTSRWQVSTLSIVSTSCHVEMSQKQANLASTQIHHTSNVSTNVTNVQSPGPPLRVAESVIAVVLALAVTPQQHCGADTI